MRLRMAVSAPLFRPRTASSGLGFERGAVKSEDGRRAYRLGLGEE